MKHYILGKKKIVYQEIPYFVREKPYFIGENSQDIHRNT